MAMKEKINLPPDYTIKQEAWDITPCSSCYGSPCCTYLPLTFLRFETRSDFIKLALLACYPEIGLGRKESGEWTVYYKSPCAFLNPASSACGIHGLAAQSLICKSYDAQTCWYRGAFRDAQNRALIRFDLPRLLWLEKRTRFSRDGSVKTQPSPAAVIKAFAGTSFSGPGYNTAARFGAHVLPFHAGGAERFLFFPPYDKPKKALHFELMRFRLGFRGMRLAIADNCWAYLLCTYLDTAAFKRFASAYFPRLAPKHNPFSFFSLHKERLIYSELGEKWVIAEPGHLTALQTHTGFDKGGNIMHIPGSREVLEIIRAVNPQKPDKAA
jgi:hypothetical protein